MVERLVHVRISGRVQGVGYRAFVYRSARRLDLGGFVRNCANGEVEAVFAGAAQAVESMLATCRQGPRHAAVDALAIEEISGSQQTDYLPLRPFAIRPSQ
jgi:acylphosphatase